MERHGLGYMLEMARQHRLRNPTRLELQMIGVLGALKLAYEREFVVCKTRMMTVDFMLPACNLAIEVHGGMHDQGKPDYRRRLQNDTDKRALLDAQNRRVLTLHHSEFKDLAGVIERVKREVQGDHSTAN